MIKDLKGIEYVNLGSFTEKDIDALLSYSYKTYRVSERIGYISSKFLGIKYKENTLIGNMDTHEVFVVNLEFLDCMTFIEYVEAMRLSQDYKEFIDNLKKIRYKNGIVSYFTRNHFFTDWIETNSKSIEDITNDIGREYAVKITKDINLKEDNTLYVPGIPHRLREFSYIPSVYFKKELIDRLSTGDYIGIFSESMGLDVSHVGIFILKDNKYFLRHASSKEKYRKVVDEDFIEYVNNKPGIIVFRPR